MCNFMVLQLCLDTDCKAILKKTFNFVIDYSELNNSLNLLQENLYVIALKFTVMFSWLVACF